MRLISPETPLQDLLSSAQSISRFLDQENVLLSEKWKSLVFSRISKIMDNTDPRLLMRLSVVLLKLNMEGKSILGPIKTLYKLSKSERNDILFREEKANGKSPVTS